MLLNKYFLEVQYHKIFKNKNLVSGDVFTSSKTDSGKVVSVLSDGLGSGIKASVLATLSATMATQFIKNNIDIKKSARIIIDTLPVCNTRKIGYSTFTVSEIDNSGNVRVIEYDNPLFLLWSGSEFNEITSEQIFIGKTDYKDDIINYYQFHLNPGDRMIFVSDGVTQSGMGMAETPLGWGRDALKKFVTQLFNDDPNISARDLSKKITARALQNDRHCAKDDITCGVIYCRNPRELLIVTGPPVNHDNDKALSGMVSAFSGRKIICGGTTAKIISRELDIPVEIDLHGFKGDITPEAKMNGIDMVTEGILTLCRTASLLENWESAKEEDNAAYRMVEIILNTDIIKFVVGTRINEVHQDPTMPVDIEIRRSIIRKIMNTLENKYLKKTELTFI